MDARHPRALFPAPVPTDSRPTIGVLALQGDVREHSLALEAAGARPVVVRRAVDLGQAPGDRLDGLVIPGGESTTMSTLLISFGMLEPLRELIDAGLPAYGSCAGMIKLLNAAHAAPSVGNSQPWDFIVVRDPATLDAFAEHVAQCRQDYS